MRSMEKRKVVSLFSSAGIGELGIPKDQLEIVVSNELIENRHNLYKNNYPDTVCITGDIWIEKENIISTYKSKCDSAPFLIYATPPCQGMSTNGVGRLMHEIRKGNRLPDDPRNRLIIPTMDIVCALRPEWLLLENVPNMQNTLIETENGEYMNIIDYIRFRLGDEYDGGPEVVNCANYGIPQTRRRLITVFTRTTEGKEYYETHRTFLPDRTHSQYGEIGTEVWVTLRDAIGDFPPLQAKAGENERKDFHPCHVVPVMKDEKYWWTQHTKPGDTAFNNQCVNPDCMYQGNLKHGSRNEGGLHVSNTSTPIYCEKCGQLLPRPSVVDRKTGVRRCIKGFESAYRRMEWDVPSPTLTQNLQFEASDKKIHPIQNRVLSIYEALVLQTIADYSYDFSINGKEIPRTLYCEVIGESVPPRLIELVCKNILKISPKA